MKILILGGDYGHQSLAEALLETLSGHFGEKNLKLVYPSSKRKADAFFYNFFYTYFPFLWNIPFQLTQIKEIQKIHKSYGRFYLPEIKKEVKKFKPDLIFSTHFIYHFAVEELQKQLKFQFYNFVSDPVTIHPIIFNLKAVNLVYDQKAVELGKKYGLPEKLLVPTGWLIRQRFFQEIGKDEARKKLNLPPDLFTILVCGGSEGTNAILKILPGLLQIKKPVQIIIVTGRNVLLYNFAKFFSKLLTKSFYVWKSLIKIKIFQFSKDLEIMIKAADLVVGKAGPNLLFETVSCQRPFFAITHIQGQENGNLELIKKKKLGWVEEDANRATALLMKIIEKPAMLEKFEKSILQEKNNLKTTGPKILELLATK